MFVFHWLLYYYFYQKARLRRVYHWKGQDFDSFSFRNKKQNKTKQKQKQNKTKQKQKQKQKKKRNPVLNFFSKSLEM